MSSHQSAKKASRNLDRFVQFALAAADQAWNDSKLGETDLDRERLAVYVGSGGGGTEMLIDGVHSLHQKDPRKISSSLVSSMSPVSVCEIGNKAIGEAYRLIRRGEADATFAGGTEAGITELSIAQASEMRRHCLQETNHLLKRVALLTGHAMVS